MAENTTLVEENKKSTEEVNHTKEKPTLDEQLNQLELELIKLIKKAETNGQLTDDVQVGLFKHVLVYDAEDSSGNVHGTYLERERFNDALSAIAGSEIADRLVGEDMVTEVGIWERTKNGDKELEYILCDGKLSISEHGKKPSIMQPTDAVISDVGRIKQSIQTSLEPVTTTTK